MTTDGAGVVAPWKPGAKMNKFLRFITVLGKTWKDPSRQCPCHQCQVLLVSVPYCPRVLRCVIHFLASIVASLGCHEISWWFSSLIDGTSSLNYNSTLNTVLVAGLISIFWVSICGCWFATICHPCQGFCSVGCFMIWATFWMNLFCTTWCAGVVNQHFSKSTDREIFAVSPLLHSIADGVDPFVFVVILLVLFAAAQIFQSNLLLIVGQFHTLYLAPPTCTIDSLQKQVALRLQKDTLEQRAKMIFYGSVPQYKSVLLSEQCVDIHDNSYMEDNFIWDSQTAEKKNRLQKFRMWDYEAIMQTPDPFARVEN